MRKGSLRDNEQKLIELISLIDFINLQTEFDKQLNNQAKFPHNYMGLFETWLLLIRASRQKNWELHLVSFHHLCKYFFAFDMTNYVRVTPVCSAKMFSLKDKDPETWSMFNKVPFLLIKHLFRFLLLV